MYQIIKRVQLSKEIFWLEVLAPRVATSAMPGQFVIVRDDQYGERIPLTICDYDRTKGTVAIVIQAIGKATKKLGQYQEGDSLIDFAGPLGNPSQMIYETEEQLKQTRRLFIAGGLGAAPVYPQAKWLYERGIKSDVIIGARSKELLILEEEMKKVCENLYISTDDGSYGFHGNVTQLLKELVEKQGKQYDEVIVIGPMIMMKFAALATKELGIKTVASMNPIMVDGTGMCGACRVTVGNKTKFACVDGPEFDAHLVDFDEAMKRQALYKTQEGRELLAATTPEPTHSPECTYPHDEYEFNQWRRVPMAEQDPKQRATNFEEVTQGYTLEEAKQEASRCINCKNAKCIKACPVAIDIPAFIQKIVQEDIAGAVGVISQASSLPAICGRVCPQEDQCEGACIRGIKGEPIAIGRLERFVGDYAIANNTFSASKAAPTGKKVAVVGSGPAGLACAGDLAKMGHEVKIFEALHEPGGVLVYGIPEFRLPKEKVVKKEIDNVRKLGVEIETNVLVGRTIRIDQLMDEEGYDAVFIGSGAGLPRFMGIPGENANGVFSANEYLTRSNLMKAYSDRYETPISIGKKVAVIGGGNVAMDAARTALRLGAEVHIVYRRSMEELPARVEEVHHAQEEGIIFDILTNPTKILVNDQGWVKGMECIKMELGEPDASGRRRPMEVADSAFTMEVDTVLMSLGTDPNPLITSTTQVDVNKWNGIVINEEGETSLPGVFAGGDAVTGSATVILAMGAGRTAAKGIDDYLKTL
ncbi:MAG: bifunctional dihydroorotate dehydrogenase B NAD binding subunit/NADPH-dependent glutamate synthase [Clostridiales bacterium]|nr:bifunctional dihydroorotate dehydrogenase B NAD binding subunit/NADPH-dependent glutamate synthase [Clostridiales bacterium]